jgi:hypothetical protein
MRFRKAVKKLSFLRGPEFIALMLMLVLVTGCVSLRESKSAIEWTEDVRLSDGSIVQLKRITELTKSGFPVQKRGLNKSHSYCYEKMQISWKTYGGYLPDIFDIVDGKAYLHLPIYGCFICEKYGYPKTNALYFTWENNKWTRIEEEDFPQQSTWNLLRHIKGRIEKDDASGHLSWEEKRGRDIHLVISQKRIGWKTISDRYLYENACEKCKNVDSEIYGNNDFLDIFLEQDTKSCQ